MNPALTGTFNGDWRAAGNYRSQWFVDNLVNYLTFTGSYDIRFYPKNGQPKDSGPPASYLIMIGQEIQNLV